MIARRGPLPLADHFVQSLRDLHPCGGACEPSQVRAAVERRPSLERPQHCRAPAATDERPHDTLSPFCRRFRFRRGPCAHRRPFLAAAGSRDGPLQLGECLRQGRSQLLPILQLTERLLVDATRLLLTRRPSDLPRRLLQRLCLLAYALGERQAHGALWILWQHQRRRPCQYHRCRRPRRAPGAGFHVGDAPPVAAPPAGEEGRHGVLAARGARGQLLARCRRVQIAPGWGALSIASHLACAVRRREACDRPRLPLWRGGHCRETISGGGLGRSCRSWLGAPRAQPPGCRGGCSSSRLVRSPRARNAAPQPHLLAVVPVQVARGAYPVPGLPIPVLHQGHAVVLPALSGGGASSRPPTLLWRWSGCWGWGCGRSAAITTCTGRSTTPPCSSRTT